MSLRALLEAVEIVANEKKRMFNLLENYGWVNRGRDHECDDMHIILFTPKDQELYSGRGYSTPLISINQEDCFWQAEAPEDKLHEDYGFDTLHQFLMNNSTWTYTR